MLSNTIQLSNFEMDTMSKHKMSKAEKNGGISALKQEIVDWLKDMLRASRAKGFVFGMSGGVDSNVTSLLAKEAAGDNHLGLILPIHNDPREREDAERVAREFGVNTKVVQLSDTYDQLLKVLPPGDDVIHTNFKSRLRMSILYYYANIHQYLVIGTINKAEFTIGYFAKYGSYGDILPLTNLLKREVRALALELGLPRDLAEKKASGCVTGSETAEEEWGIPEGELDEIIAHWDEQEIRHPKIEELRRLSDIANHKRHYPPIFLPSKKKV